MVWPAFYVVWVIAIDLRIYVGYCHLPSSKASIKSWQQCLLKIHVLVVWLLINFFLYYISCNFFWCHFTWVEQVACRAGVFFFYQVNSFAWWKQYSVIIIIRFIVYPFTAVTVTNLTLISSFDNQIFAHIAGLSQSEVRCGSVPSLSVP